MRRILGRVAPHEFVGRTNDLQQIVSHPTSTDARGILLLRSPAAGASELLRQAYDELFNRRGDIIPIYFAGEPTESTAVGTAGEFLNAFLRQYIAYRRDTPALSNASLTLEDIVELAPSTDYEWIRQLTEAYQRERFGSDAKEFVRFCLTAPQKVPVQNGRPFLIVDDPQFAGTAASELFGGEMVKVLTRSGLPFLIAGLRRHILVMAQEAGCLFGTERVLRVDKIQPDDLRQIVEHTARRTSVEINDETRDLLVQQSDGRPLFATLLLQAAKENGVPLTSYVDLERLYVDDLMGGYLKRHFTWLLDQIVPDAKVRRSLIKFLHETTSSTEQKVSFESCRKRLSLESSELERLLSGLHVQEFVNWDGWSIETATDAIVWTDYLNTRYRLDVANEPRALVVAQSTANALKRAPPRMSLSYRRAATVGLREMLVRFNGQHVPTILFDHHAFDEKYKAVGTSDILAALDAEKDLISLPQLFHAASCAAFNRNFKQFCDEEHCVVAHGFEGQHYTDSSEVVWLVAEIRSKGEADRTLVEVWCDRLEAFAKQFDFGRIQIWLISNEGFSGDATAFLEGRNIYGSNRQQADLLASRLTGPAPTPQSRGEADEFVVILPMGEDHELLAAGIIEQIARKVNFKPEAINQIKTAVVEACINASEHSYSPDQKIYQRFRVENDRLVITVSSRGVVPSNLQVPTIKEGAIVNSSQERRGWGLKLIKSLMDEVEFERVDDGTRLRMTKYLRSGTTE